MKVTVKDGKVCLERKCPSCGKVWNVVISVEQFTEMQTPGSKRIQEILPDVPAAEREFFLTGICPECWNNIFAEEE